MSGLKIYHGRRIEDLAEKGSLEFLKVAAANPNLGN